MHTTAVHVTMAALALTAACATDGGEPATATEDSEIVSPLPEDIAITVSGTKDCVDVANYSMSNGGPIHQWSCHYDANQLWRFTPVGAEGEAVYAITSRLSGLALDVTAVSTAPGAPIQQWGYGGGNNQKFRVLDAGGKFQLQAVHSGMCMSVTNTGTDADRDLGVLFRQYPCAASDWHQLFQLKRRAALTQKALVVLLQNGGYTGGLPFNPGFDIPTGLHFWCDGHAVDLGLGASVWDAIHAIGMPAFDRCLNPGNWSVTTLTRHYTAADFVRDMTNFVAESIGKWTVESSGAKSSYTQIVYLTDKDIRASKVRQQLQALASSYVIDVHVLAHGDATSFGLNGEMNDFDIRGLRTIVGLTLRSVFQQNSNGSGLNNAWLYAGAQVVTGTAGINSMPIAYGPFIRRWVAGESFFDAVQHSYNDAVPMHQAAYRFVDIYDEGASQPRDPPEYSPTGGLSPDDELSGSIQIVQGNGALVL